MTDQTAGASLADWLAVHGLTADLCRAVLQRAEVPGPVADPDWPSEPAALWPQIAQVLAAQMPQGAGVIGQTLASTRTDFSGAGRWGGRSFTLHDDGQGNPLVVSHLKGRLSDLLTLAHEFGHAVQIVACRSDPLPPILREVCAHLAERLVARAWAWTDPDLAAQAAALVMARGARKREAVARALVLALDHPATPYDYDWNYPVAHHLAAVAAGMAAADQWRLFSGRSGLADLTGRLA